jgi:hypothetical protein
MLRGTYLSLPADPRGGNPLSIAAQLAPGIDTPAKVAS